MEIKRNRSIEEWLFEEIRNNWGSNVREGIHLSDLLSPRQAYWQRIKPMKPTDLQIQYWLTGQGHEGAISRASGYEHAESRQWSDIHYTPDFFHNFPCELKTRRRNLAEEGKEAETYEHYLRQLKGYCAVENKTHGWLHIWALVQKQDDGTTKPEIGCYEIDFTREELEEERQRLIQTQAQLLCALEMKDHTILPICTSWMCGRESKTMVKKPYCETCNGREFETEWGINKHITSRTGEGHTVIMAEYETNYVKSCGWYDDCIGGMKNEN
jgi:hypothetical protein